MKKEKLKNIDLRVPAQCREFLKSIRVDGRAVTQFELESKKIITVDEMTDDQAVYYANQMYVEWLGGSTKGGPVSTNIDRGLQ